MARAGLVYGLMRAGSREEAMTADKDLIIAADVLAALLGRLGREESAATIAGFAFGHLSRA
jgi:hypothetical protein